MSIRRRAHAFAGAAGILRADVAVHQEARRLDVELLADVFPDQYQALATGDALAGLGFVAVLDARQLGR